MTNSTSPVRIYALGGLGEVGKNTYCIENDNSIILLDAGVKFPDTTLPGVDYVIPDYSYLKSNRSKVKALFITHGHEDHIGGIPFLVRSINVPVIYAPKLAAALIRNKIDNARIKEPIKIIEYDSNDIFRIGQDFTVSFFRVTHSIPDSFGICVDTSEGRIVDSGDFKIDLTPVGPRFELDKLSRIGNEGVDLLLADSTNAELEGYTPSETNVKSGLEEIFDKAPGRIIVSTFSSNINRIQQVVEAAIKRNRKLCIIGRSMVNTVQIAREYGYIKVPNESIVEEATCESFKDKEMCILCTGSQGEPMAALSRIVNGENKNVHIGLSSDRFHPDTIVFSSNPIPGNGALVSKLVNNLVRLGADVKQNGLAFSLHSSGHPSRQELRLMLALVRPKYFMPAHGEYRMLKLHGDIAESLGMSKDHIFLCDNGDQLILEKHKVKRGIHISAEDVYIDGNSLDGVASAVINDRDVLTKDGMVAILVSLDTKTNKLLADPTVYTRGFADNQNLHVVRHAQMEAAKAINEILKHRISFGELKSTVKNAVAKYIYRKTERSPMIIPVIMNANGEREEKC